MENTRYVACEPDESQYEEFDFSNESIVPARYIRPRIKKDEGNPYIEALPYPRTDRQIQQAYNRTLYSYDPDKAKNAGKLDKMLQVEMLRQLRFPLPFHSELEFSFYSSLLTSYRARHQIKTNEKGISYTAFNEEFETDSILSGSSSDSTNAGFSLIGYSGCGKSSAISILVSHYPQVIMHDDGDDGYYPQIVYLVVNCTPNSNFSALYEGIGDAIDKAFNNAQPVYSREIAKISGLGRKAEKVKELVEKFAVGIIIFDEIQLIDFEHTKENTFDSLLTLANRTKVAIAVVGTEDARDKMFNELRTARRIGNMINGNLYCNNKRFFEFLAKQLFMYQWFDEPVELTQNIIDALYDVTKGIIDQLIGIYLFMNVDYIKREDNRPVVDAAYVYKTAEKYYPGIQKVLAGFENGENENKLAVILRDAKLKLNRMMDEAKQDKVMQELINNNKDQNVVKTVKLRAVIDKIEQIYDEYSDSQIEKTFNKIIGKKGNEHKSEKEITRLVVEALQKTPKRNVSKTSSKQPGTDIEHMKSFLGIGDSDDDTSN